jgi:hypothetical protein
LRRFPASFLNYDQMLALAALGLPIVLTVHPEDLRFRNFGLWNSPRWLNHCDGVLRFAAAKGLRPLSLEQIARESIEESLHREVSHGLDALRTGCSEVALKEGSVSRAVA